MKSICYTALLAVLLLQGCGHAEQYNQKVKSLDSLNGALNLKVKELQRTDTALLQRCITRFNYYRQFIKQNINDTLNKREADNLQHFYISGKNLEVFQSNRFSILGRASLLNSQQNRLAQDIENRTMEVRTAEQYLNKEKEATAQLIEAANAQQQLFYGSVEEFKGALSGVEELIRSHNKGELPKIVKDTTSL
jgi:outer membrane murein-binding lipoprotein Lpp